METVVIVETAADFTSNEDAGYMNRVFIGSLPKWVRLPNFVMKVVLLFFNNLNIMYILRNMLLTIAGLMRIFKFL